MKDAKGTDSRPAVPTPTRRTTSLSATLFQVDSIDVPEDDIGHWVDKQQLGYRSVPYKSFVDSLMLPSSIGAAVAAIGAFTILSADSILGDDSPQSLVQRKAMFQTLVWSTELFGVAAGITVCLQALYGSPSFCKILSKKLNPKPELRTKFDPCPSPDFLRYVVAWTVVGAAYFALILLGIASILMVKAFEPYAPTVFAKIFIVLIPTLGTIGFIISLALEQPRATEFLTRLLRLPAVVSAPSPEQRVV